RLVAGQHLEGDGAVEFDVARLVHLAHAAGGEVGDDRVAADAGARIKRLGCHGKFPASTGNCTDAGAGRPTSDRWLSIPAVPPTLAGRFKGTIFSAEKPGEEPYPAA